VTRLITEIAPAKINLALHVRARLPDGYHAIETLFAFARDGDTVTVEESAFPSFAVTGPFAAALDGEGDNLVTRAAAAFSAGFGIDQPHAIVLDKRLPVASGIGGGSADAAAALRALARLHGIAPDDSRLLAAAAPLGADLPACLYGQTSLGTGRGDELVPIEGLPGTPLLLVNPRVAVSTDAVFRGWDGVDRGAIADGGLMERARAGRNDLSAPAIAIAPVISLVEATLAASDGVLLARMSGSGATCFALFAQDEARDAAEREAAARGWWTLATSLA
jgi:4-diphosphocytidyl-2-C-methyl-D-erythritol kinase